jgi:hypothetical protein
MQQYAEELACYATTRAIGGFPSDGQIPVPLVRKLVKASLKVMKGSKS